MPRHLRPLPGIVLLALIPLALQAQQAPTPNTPLPWAYAVNTPGLEVHWETTPYTVPGSTAQFTFPRDRFSPPDWHPEGHPEMPTIVSQGRQPSTWACGYCHLPNGQGRPENSSLAGLPAEYIIQQLADWRAGLRRGSEPNMAPPELMFEESMHATPEEVAIAAEYFASLTPKKWIRVVETDTVPQTQVLGWMYIVKEGGGSEALGRRIIETAEDLERTEVRDDSSGFVAYVPPGSVAAGKALADGSKTAACTLCHGADLRGLGPVPGLAGRSPSYLARQLWDMKTGQRRGLWSPLMAPVVAPLSTDDILELAAYAASLDP